MMNDVLSGPPGLTFATAIGGRAVRGPWQPWLREILGASGIGLAGDELSVDGAMFGFFRLVELAELAPARRGQAWLAPPACPWTGDPVGVFAWTHTVDERPALERLIPALMMAGRSPLVRLGDDGGGGVPSMHVRRFGVEQLFSKHGFDGGGALLRDEDYLEDARRRAQAALATAGLSAEVGTWEDGNPLRIAGPVSRAGRQLGDAELERAVRGLELELWAINLAALGQPALWAE
jgi:hypothetical protein